MIPSGMPVTQSRQPEGSQRGSSHGQEEELAGEACPDRRHEHSLQAGMELTNAKIEMCATESTPDFRRITKNQEVLPVLLVLLDDVASDGRV